jgi:hypothetical protein
LAPIEIGLVFGKSYYNQEAIMKLHTIDTTRRFKRTLDEVFPGQRVHFIETAPRVRLADKVVFWTCLLAVLVLGVCLWLEG